MQITSSVVMIIFLTFECMSGNIMEVIRVSSYLTEDRRDFILLPEKEEKKKVTLWTPERSLGNRVLGLRIAILI